MCEFWESNRRKARRGGPRLRVSVEGESAVVSDDHNVRGPSKKMSEKNTDWALTVFRDCIRNSIAV